MIVQCAACKARFKISDEKVTERGVKVRCTKCATTFVVRKDSAPPAPDSVPLGGKPPAGTGSFAPAAGPPAGLPRAQTLPPGAMHRIESKVDPFAPFQTSELKPVVDPFAGAGGTGSTDADPFADMDLGSDPVPSTPPPGLMDMAMPDLIGVGSQRATPAPSQAPRANPADPFAALASPAASRPATPAADPFASLAGPAAPSRPAAPAADPFAALSPAPKPAPRSAPSADPFAALQSSSPAAAPRAPAPNDPFAAMQSAAPPASAPRAPVQTDPFAALAAPSPQPPRPAAIPNDPFAGMQSTPGHSADPFAALQGAAQPAPATAPRSALRAGSDPFADMKLDAGPPVGVPPPQASAPRRPEVPPIDLGGSLAASDPFAGIGAGAAGGAAVGASFGELDIDGSGPSGLDLDGPPRPGAAGDPFNKSEAAAELFGPRPPSQRQPTPLPPAGRPSAGIPLADKPSPQARATSRPEAVESAAAVAAARAAATASWARRPKARKVERKRSTASTLLNSAFIGLLGLVILGGSVYRTVLAAADEVNGAVAARPLNDLVPEDVTNGFYETKAARSVFFVQGKLRNLSHAPIGPVNVRVELLKGSTVARNAEVAVGALPSPEEVYGVVNPSALAALNQRLAAGAVPVAPGATADFFVVFYEYPDDLPLHELRLSPQSIDQKQGKQRKAPATQNEAPPKEAKPTSDEAAAQTKAEPAQPETNKPAGKPAGAKRVKGTKVRFSPPAGDKK